MAKSDNGKDLIGTIFDRGGDVLYEAIDRIASNDKQGNQRIYIKALAGKNIGQESRHVVADVRANLKRGYWKEKKHTRISKGADDLIGKRFTSHSNPIIIQDSTHYDFDVRICYEDKSATDWDVGIKSIRDWIEKGTLVHVPDKPKVDTGSDLIGRKFTSHTRLIVYTFDHINPDNRMVVSWVQPSGEISTTDYSMISVRNHLSKSWVIKKPEPVKNAIRVNDWMLCISPSKFFTEGTKYLCTNIEPYGNDEHWLHAIGDNGKSDFHACFRFEKCDAPPIIELFKPHNSESSEISPWQSYDANTETYSTKQEENIMTNPQTQIQVTVSTKAFATVKEFDTIYGRPVKEMNEGDLFNALRTIERDYKVLKDLDVKDSKRVKAQMTKLKKARGKVIAALDALPEDEDES